MTNDDPLFTSTHSALSFAFNYADRAWKPNLLQRLAEKDRLHTGRGLSGIDGAGQAGMIRREVEGLPQLQKAVIVCKFARTVPCGSCGSMHDPRERREAIEVLVHYTLEVLEKERPNLALRRALVRKHFGDRMTMADVAKACGVHQNTVTNHGKAVKKVIGKLERDAMSALDEALRSILLSEADAAA